MHDQPFGFYRLNDPTGATKAGGCAGDRKASIRVAHPLIPGPAGRITGDLIRLSGSRDRAGSTAGVEVPMAATEYLSDGEEITLKRG